METKTKLDEELDEVDNYEQAINASLALIHIYSWDVSSGKSLATTLHWLGKEYNPGKVTPDITLQLSSDRGIVIELKESLPRNDGTNPRDLWAAKFEQIKKYDVELVGWDTKSKKVKEQELVLLVNQKFTQKVKAYIQSKNLEYNNFSKSFCIIQYAPANGRKEAIFIRKEEGRIGDFSTVKEAELVEGVTVEMRYLLSSGLSSVKFLDYKPPVTHTMNILWKHIFTSMISLETWRQSNIDKERVIDLDVKVKDLVEKVRNEYADKSSKSSLQESWIEEALDKFAFLKYAKKMGDGAYQIKYRKKPIDWATELYPLGQMGLDKDSSGTNS